MSPHPRGANRTRVIEQTALESIRRAQGMPGEGLTRGPPANKKRRRQSPQVKPDHPAFPARWFYGLYVISLGTGLSCPHHRADVISATYRQRRGDRTTRFRRPRRHRSSAHTRHARHHRVHRIPRSTCRDDRPKRPSFERGGMAQIMLLIYGKVKSIFENRNRCGSACRGQVWSLSTLKQTYYASFGLFGF